MRLKEIQKEQAKKVAEDTITGNHFKTLLGYRKLISVLGWIWIILCIGGVVIGLLAGLSGVHEGWLIMGGSFFSVLFGIGMVASGQLISCFVAIEKNTRATNELLQTRINSKNK